MIGYERDAAAMAQIRKYADAAARAECVRVRLAGASSSLSDVVHGLGRDGLAGCEDVLRGAAGDVPDIQADIGELIRAFEDLRDLGESLDRMGLGGVLRRPGEWRDGPGFPAASSVPVRAA